MFIVKRLIFCKHIELTILEIIINIFLFNVRNRIVEP